MRRLVISAVAFLLSLLGTLPSPAEPEQKLGILVEGQGIGRVISDVQKLSDSLGSRDPAGIRKLIGSMVMTEDFRGLDTNAPFYSCIFLGPGAANITGPKRSPTLVLPLAGDGKAYLESLDKIYSRAPVAQAPGIVRLSPPDSDLSGRPELYLVVANGKAFIGADQAQVARLAKTPLTAFMKDSGMDQLTGVLRVGVDMAVVVCADETGMKNPSTEFLLNLLKQIKTFAIAGRLDGKILEFTYLTTPAAGTTAAVMPAPPSPSKRYLCALPPDALLATVGSGMDQLDRVNEQYGEMISKLYGARGGDMDKVGAKLSAMVTAMKGQYAGDYAIGLVPTPGTNGVGLVQVFAVKDTARMRAITATNLHALAALSETTPDTTVALNPPRVYKGVEILSFTLSAGASKAAARRPGLPPPLFSGFRGHFAFVGNDMIHVMGDPALMEAAIDRLGSGGLSLDQSAVFRGLFPDLAGVPLKLHTLEPIRLFKILLASMPNMDPLILDAFPKNTPGIAGYSVLSGRDTRGVERIGLAELAGFKDLIPMGGMLLASLMPKPQGESSAASSPAAKCRYNLRMIAAAKEQCALERNLQDGQAVESTWLPAYLLNRQMPACPAGGQYSVNAVGQDPRCSMPGHALQPISR